MKYMNTRLILLLLVCFWFCNANAQDSSLQRYDLFMNSFTEKTWTMPIFNKTMQQYPPRPLQSETYTGPTEITRFRNLQEAKKFLDEKGIKLTDDIKVNP